MKIDIIIPCYYSDDIIRPCLQSIAEQTLIKDINVIMVNDCSPNTKDEYQGLINEFNHIMPIRYLKTQTNVGPGVARQLGLDISTSNWVMFIDDDDELYDEYAVETLTKHIKPSVLSISGRSLILFDKNYSQFEVHEASTHHQGTIYNRVLLKSSDIKFDSRLSYREEDGAFSSAVLYSAIGNNYELVFLNDLVYTKKCCIDGYTSLTSKPIDAECAINFLGLKALEIKYKKLYKYMENDIDEQLIVIANMLDYIANHCSYPIDQRQYANLESYIKEIEPYIRNNYLIKEPSIYCDMYNQIFADVYKKFDYETFIAFCTEYENWLKKVKVKNNL